MTTDRRPLSPHLQIYKPQITSTLSITHRITGLLLALGSVLLAYWLAAIAAGPEAFDAARAFFSSVVGRLALLAITLSFSFHLCSGIRHLFWDAGKGLDLATARASGWVVIVASLLLTLVLYLVAYGVAGGGA